MWEVQEVQQNNEDYNKERERESYNGDQRIKREKEREIILRED